MLESFYGAFAPLSFTVLGLWFIIVQTRHADWSVSREHRRRASAVSVQFALPGLMSLLSLVDPGSKTLWRVAFTATSVIGALTLLALSTGRLGRRRSSAANALQWLAAAFFAAIAAVAISPAIVTHIGISAAPLRVEAFMLSLLVFLGVTVAWLLLFDDVPATGPRT
jgi:hypothetical protein